MEKNPPKWVGGPARKYSHFVAPSCTLRLARFSADLIFGIERETKDTVVHIKRWFQIKMLGPTHFKSEQNLGF